MSLLTAKQTSTIEESEGMLGVELIRHPDQWILKLTEEIDPNLSNPTWVSKLLTDLIAAQVPTLVIDLASIETISSRELGLLLNIRKRFSEAEIEIILHSPGSHLSNLFRIMHFDRFFRIE